MKDIKHLLAALTLPVILLTACDGRNASSDDSVAATNSDSVVVSDSAASADSIKKPTEAPERKFASAQEALDFMHNSGHWSEYQAGILPRMAEEVLEYAGKLLNNKYNYFIVVDKAAMKVILYDKYGREVKEYPCAASKNYGHKKRKGDSRTAEGYFTAEGVYDSTDWLFTNDAGYTSPAKGQFGPRFIRLKGAPQIGIHGTAAPRSIGKRVSHGCIRLTNENIMDLVKYAQAGMPIIVSPGPQDMRVNQQEGTPIPAVTTGAKRAEPAPEPEKPKQTSDTKKTTKKDSVKQTNTAPAEESKTETVKPAEESKEKPAEEKPSTPPAEPTTPPAE